MIQYVHTDIFKTPAEVLVNPVNCKGVMGAGLALEFKKRNQKMFTDYQNACKAGLLTPGKLMLCSSDSTVLMCDNLTCIADAQCGGCRHALHVPSYKILLFPTKDDWRDNSKIEYIESGLKKFVDVYEQKNIRSIAFPKLGCGKGGLAWSAVRLIMERYLSPLPIQIYICI